MMSPLRVRPAGKEPAVTLKVGRSCDHVHPKTCCEYGAPAGTTPETLPRNETGSQCASTEVPAPYTTVLVNTSTAMSGAVTPLPWVFQVDAPPVVVSMRKIWPLFLP